MESINTNLGLPTQKKTDFTKSARHEKESIDQNLSRKIQTLETISSYYHQMKKGGIPKRRKIETKSRRHICIIDNFVLIHLTGPGICKNEQVQVKAHPGATTDEIIDCIKPTIHQKPDIAIIHS